MIPILDFTTLLAACAVVALAMPSCGQSDQKKAPLDPAVAALLDKMSKQRGPTSPAKDTTIVIEGDFAVTAEDVKGPVAEGTFRDLFAGSDLARETSSMGEMGAMEKGVHKDVVWEVDPMMGAKKLRGAHAASARRYFALLRGDDPRAHYREITIAKDKTGENPGDVVLHLKPDEGAQAIWFVAADGTLQKVETALPAPESADAAFGLNDALPATITFTEWKTVDGGRFPMKRTLQMGKATVSFVCRTVTVGTPIDAAKFEPPPAVAKLKNEPTEPAVGTDGKPNYQLVERAAQPVASIRAKIKPSDITTTLSTMLPEVYQHLTAIGAKMAGPPFSRYHAWSDTEIDIEAGIPVTTPIEAKGRIGNSELPGGKTLTAWHIGPYENLGKAHEGLRANLAERKLVARGGAWEVYWTDPGMVPDPAKWRTQLFLLVQ